MLGKGAKPADVPCPSRCCWSEKPSTAADASRALTRVAHAAGISIRDMQYAMRHADPRTTMRYDMAMANLDTHATHAVAAYLAGTSTG